MKPERIWVTPAKDLLVPIPTETRKFLPPEGAEVTKSIYWLRREKSAEVTIKPVPKKSQKATTSTDEGGK